MINKFLTFLDKSPTSYNAALNIVDELKKHNFIKIEKNTKIKPNNKYYITKNDSTVIAFDIGDVDENSGFNIIASHLDCPTFKIKPNPIIKVDGYNKLNVEVYGGAIMSTWLDRPLSFAGRVIVKENGVLKSKIVNIEENIAIIPNVAIHMNREVNTGYHFNVKNDMTPIISLKKNIDFKEFLKEKTKITGEILTYDLFLYPRINAYSWNDEFISSFHIDNLGCAYSTFNGFLNAKNSKNINVYASFDNEEVGSLTQQGADSNFLYDILFKISNNLNLDYLNLIDNSFMISADNGHAIHPNHPEYTDVNNKCYINEGIEIKYNAAQSYTSDAFSSGVLIDILNENKIKYQFYTNRSDLRGGGTLGNLSNGHVSLPTVDIGLPQLAMHSSLETCGINDYLDLIEISKVFYEKKLKKVTEGYVLE